jgi:hypothetical protein
MKFLFSMMLLFSVSTAAMASEVSALARPFAHSCGYFSQSGVEVDLFFSDSHLPWDAQVNLIYGLGSEEQNLDWERRQVVPTFKAGLSNTRQVKISVPLISRSEYQRYDLLQFTWEIRRPGGQVYYDNGGDSAWGFYQASVDSSQASACHPVIEFQPLELFSVERD